MLNPAAESRCPPECDYGTTSGCTDAAGRGARAHAYPAEARPLLGTSGQHAAWQRYVGNFEPATRRHLGSTPASSTTYPLPKYCDSQFSRRLQHQLLRFGRVAHGAVRVARFRAALLRVRSRAVDARIPVEPAL